MKEARKGKKVGKRTRRERRKTYIQTAKSQRVQIIYTDNKNDEL